MTVGYRAPCPECGELVQHARSTRLPMHAHRKSAKCRKVALLREMEQRAARVIGLRIVDVELHPFADERPGRSAGLAFNPVLVLDDGSKVGFIVQETHGPEYGVLLAVRSAGTAPAGEARASRRPARRSAGG